MPSSVLSTPVCFLARDLTNEPAAAIYPETFAAAALELKKIGVKVEVLDEAAMEKLGMGAILAEAKAATGHHVGGSALAKQSTAPLAIIGKGITFDTGGYNLKTDAASIVRMTSDMAGAAAALGTIKALALQKAPVNVVAIMALAENKISDRAMLPGDVITSAAGLTIQVGNTDAEGRLVLADGLWLRAGCSRARAARASLAVADGHRCRRQGGRRARRLQARPAARPPRRAPRRPRSPRRAAPRRTTSATARRLRAGSGRPRRAAR